MKKIILSLSGVLALIYSLHASTLSNVIQNSSLIVYNSNIGLVHEQRDVEVDVDDTFITYEGVASSIDTDSVNVQLPQGVTLYSQQYRFDKLTQNKLLDAHIEKEVQVRVPVDNNSFDILSATLLANNGATTLVRTRAKKILSVSSSDIIFKSVPQELITKPSLVWNIKSDADIKGKLELDYLLKNISFKSDYILNVDGERADLIGWISIDNRSGKRFEQTKLSLLAGDINRVQNEQAIYKQVRSMALNTAPEVAHQAYEGYHFYSIPFKVTLANNEKTQLKFLQKDAIDIHKEYSATLTNPLYLHGEREVDVTQFISLQGLDAPLPKGVLRTYSKLNSQTILLGESSLKHTPKDTPIKLNIGKNFDVKVTQTALTRDDDKRKLDATVLYSIKNSSAETKEVELLIPFNRHEDSKINSKKKYTFTKGNFVTFSLLVPAQTSQSFKVNFKSKK